MKARAIAAAAVFAAVGGTLAARFFAALPAEVARERGGACAALAPRVVGGAPVAFELPDASGHVHRLDEYRGKTVLVNFWATWCPPCVAEFPSMQAMAKRFSGGKFVMLAVAVDDTWDPVRAFFRERGEPLDGDGPRPPASMTVLLDPKGDVAARYGTDKFPESYLIDPEGQLVYHFVNARDWDGPEARACLQSLLD